MCVGVCSTGIIIPWGGGRVEIFLLITFRSAPNLIEWPKRECDVCVTMIFWWLSFSTDLTAFLLQNWYSSLIMILSESLCFLSKFLEIVLYGKTAVSSTKLNVLENVELELQSLQVFSFWTRTRQNQKLNQRL